MTALCFASRTLISSRSTPAQLSGRLRIRQSQDRCHAPSASPSVHRLDNSNAPPSDRRPPRRPGRQYPSPKMSYLLIATTTPAIGLVIRWGAVLFLVSRSPSEPPERKRTGPPRVSGQLTGG
jgi:hypothetical protein